MKRIVQAISFVGLFALLSGGTLSAGIYAAIGSSDLNAFDAVKVLVEPPSDPALLWKKNATWEATPLEYAARRTRDDLVSEDDDENKIDLTPINEQIIQYLFDKMVASKPKADFKDALFLCAINGKWNALKHIFEHANFDIDTKRDERTLLY